MALKYETPQYEPHFCDFGSLFKHLISFTEVDFIYLLINEFESKQFQDQHVVILTLCSVVFPFCKPYCHSFEELKLKKRSRLLTFIHSKS